MEEIRIGSRILQPHRQLLAGGKRVALGKRALDILSVLAKERGEIVTKDELLEAVWPNVTVEENALQVHVVALRKALGDDADRLETVRGIGYRLIPSQGPAGPANAAPEAEAFQAPDLEEPPTQRDAHIPSEETLARPWTTRPRLLALLLAAAIAVIIAVWAASSGPPARSEARAQLVVRALEASGTGDPDEVAFAKGITDELIVRLRRIPELQVATARPDGSAPSSTFEQAHVVDGSIRTDGDRLRVTARLTDERGEILWSETFDRKIADVFDMQERIAKRIADTLSVSLDVGVSSVAHGGTNDHQAYAAYFLGLVHLLDFDQTVPQRHFERAIELDPDFVQAHANLAASYGNRIYSAATPAEAERMLAEMDSTSARALELGPDLWIGSVARAWFEITRKNLGAAERLIGRVVKLDKGREPLLKDMLSQYWLTTGRNRKALAYDAAKAEIDPIYQASPRTTFVYMMNGRYDEAIDMFERLRVAETSGLEAFTYHVFWARMLAGKEAEAMAFARELDLPNVSAAAEQVRTFDAAGLGAMTPAAMRKWADRTYGFGGQFQLGNLAFAAAYNGHERLAVDLLRIAFERPGGYGLFYLWHPVLAAARKTEAFEALVTDLGFVELWRESGDWGDFCQPASGGGIDCQ